jgi:hypothetical protein
MYLSLEESEQTAVYQHNDTIAFEVCMKLYKI